MVSEGCRKVDIIVGPLGIVTPKERLEGYKKALRDAGMEFAKAWWEGKICAEKGFVQILFLWQTIW